MSEQYLIFIYPIIQDPPPIATLFQGLRSESIEFEFAVKNRRVRSTSVRPGIAVGTPEQKGYGHVMLRAAFENTFEAK